MQDTLALESTAAAEEILALRAECERLQALVGSLLLKNQELRFAAARPKQEPAADLTGARADA